MARATSPNDLLERLVLTESSCLAPLHPACEGRPLLGAVVGSLAVGGAERIVLDWARRNSARYDIRIYALSEAAVEWPVPPGVTVVRAPQGRALEGLQRFARDLQAEEGRELAPRPRVLCHLTKAVHRRALEAAGVTAVPVLHNAQEGWKEPFSEFSTAARIVAVSHACRVDLTQAGYGGEISLVRHLPAVAKPPENARARLCAQLGLPSEGHLLAMVGGVKPQKNYPFALEVLKALSERVDAYLVVFGGPIGQAGEATWTALMQQVVALGLQERVRFTGFVPNAAELVGAFDALLNTSHFEGLSIATLEALLARLPVIASAVGGQGEISSAGLTLLPAGTHVQGWCHAIERALQAARPQAPSWTKFPAHRLWTLESLVKDGPVQDRALFVTANLNSGGAQRSLVNLVRELKASLSLEVVVTGSSTSDYFTMSLQQANVSVSCTAASRDCFDHAEALLRIVARTHCRTVFFWNLDPKIKLLLAKVLPAQVQLVDVSPGAYAFEEMAQATQFQQLCGYSQAEYYARLAHLVFKFDSAVPSEVRCPTRVIRNGVVAATAAPVARAPRLIVNGRIAPSKFLLEILAAVRSLWAWFPELELHVLGAAEPRHAQYAAEVTQQAASDSRVTFHGAQFDLAAVAQPGDVAIVLGHNQGCPNAVLEAMALRMAVVANDSGGTAELVKPDSGVLLRTTEPSELADALARLLAEPARRTELGRAGRARIDHEFSMAQMTQGYLSLIQSLWNQTHAEACH